MFLFTIKKIEELVERYTKSYTFSNRIPDLAVMLTTQISEENKEYLLNDIDNELRDWVNFSHEYENGKLQIIFK